MEKINLKQIKRLMFRHKKWEYCLSLDTSKIYWIPYLGWCTGLFGDNKEQKYGMAGFMCFEFLVSKVIGLEFETALIGIDELNNKQKLYYPKQFKTE